MQINFRNPQFLRSARLVIAAIVGILITKLSSIQHSVWIVISIIVVLYDQSTVGGTIQKGIFRASATILSAIISIFTIYVFHNNLLINEIVSVIGIFLYGYFFMGTKKSYIGSIGGVTLAILLLSSIGDANAAISRATTIVIGVILAALTMIFFFPQYANKTKNQILVHLLSQLENRLSNFMNKNISLEELHTDFVIYERGYIQQLAQINRLMEESKFEIKIFHKKYLNNKLYQDMILHFRRINRLTGVLVHHLSDNKPRFDNNVAIVLNTIIEEIMSIKHFILKNMRKDQKQFSDLNLTIDTNNHEVIFIIQTAKHILSEICLIQRIILNSQ